MLKHKSKLRAFDFKVIYEPGNTTPSDYPSRHPPPRREYTKQEREELGIESEEEDAEIVIARIDNMIEAVTLETLAEYTDKEYSQLKTEIIQGKAGPAVHKIQGMKDCYHELAVHQGLILRGDRLLIPTQLRPDILASAHEGCPGGDSMLRMMRQDV